MRRKIGSCRAPPALSGIFRHEAVFFRLDSRQVRLQSVGPHAAVRQPVLMRFYIRPLLQHIASHSSFVQVIGLSYRLEPDIDRLSDAETKIFEREGHLGGRPGFHRFEAVVKGLDAIDRRIINQTRIEFLKPFVIDIAITISSDLTQAHGLEEAFQHELGCFK